MNPKQKAFVREYLIDHNATQAATRAGYSPRTANEQGARLLAHVSVKAAIVAGEAEAAEGAEVTKDKVAAILTQMVAREDGKISQANRLRAIAELNKMLGFYAAEKLDLKVPVLNLTLHMNDPQKPGLE